MTLFDPWHSPWMTVHKLYNFAYWKFTPHYYFFSSVNTIMIFSVLYQAFLFPFPIFFNATLRRCPVCRLKALNPKYGLIMQNIVLGIISIFRAIVVLFWDRILVNSWPNNVNNLWRTNYLRPAGSFMVNYSPLSKNQLNSVIHKNTHNISWF